MGVGVGVEGGGGGLEGVVLLGGEGGGHVVYVDLVSYRL